MTQRRCRGSNEKAKPDAFGWVRCYACGRTLKARIDSVTSERDRLPYHVAALKKRDEQE